MVAVRTSMRIAALVLAAVAIVGAGVACRADPPSAPPEPSPYRATSTVRELMQSVVAPSAQGLWDAVGTISNAQGTVHLEPRTDAEWAAVRRHAVTLIESTNLLVIPGRRVAPAGASILRADEADPGAELSPAEIEPRVQANWPGWVGMAQTLHEAGRTMLAEIDRKDAAGLLRTGSDLDAVCERCHLAFWYPPRPKGSE